MSHLCPAQPEPKLLTEMFDALNKDHILCKSLGTVQIHSALNLDTLLTRWLIWLSGPDPLKYHKLDAYDASAHS